VRQAEEAIPRLFWFNFAHPFSTALLLLPTTWMAGELHRRSAGLCAYASFGTSNFAQTNCNWGPSKSIWPRAEIVGSRYLSQRPKRVTQVVGIADGTTDGRGAGTEWVPQMAITKSPCCRGGNARPIATSRLSTDM
jgi:hypothetical protein